MNGISALTLSSNNFLHNDFLSEFTKRFNISSTDVKHEISLVRKLVNDNTLTVTQFLIELFPYKKAFEGIYRLLLLAVTLPVTSASCERSFSKMRIVKTFLRNSMSNNRLSNIALLSIESKRAESIDFDNFVDEFDMRYENRRIKLHWELFTFSSFNTIWLRIKLKFFNIVIAFC